MEGLLLIMITGLLDDYAEYRSDTIARSSRSRRLPTTPTLYFQGSSSEGGTGL